MILRPYQPQFSIHLRDGTEAIFRQLLPSDKFRLEKGLKMLSDESIYKRFFMPVQRFSSEELKYLTEVDQRNHVAWGCLSPEFPHLPGLGLARFVRLKEDPRTAEFAITVLDELQHKGLGTAFLALLVALAPYHNIRSLMGYVLYSNYDFLDMLRQIGEVHPEGGGINRVIIPVDDRVIEGLDNPYANYFRKALGEVREKLNG
ncbi:MAG: N-acetyltransferase [Bacteroidia bacterium]|nr:N-acetyltransferase [Bacteroidia bacterium]